MRHNGGTHGQAAVAHFATDRHMMTRRRGLTLILLGIGVAIVGALGIALSGLYRDGTGSDPSAAVLAVWLVPLVGFVVSMLGVLILIQGPPERPVPKR